VTITGGMPHLVAPGAGTCQTGRKVSGVDQLTKQPKCPNRAMRNSEYCESCRAKVLERMAAKR
jgi:hypothetical protein